MRHDVYIYRAIKAATGLNIIILKSYLISNSYLQYGNSGHGKELCLISGHSNNMNM